MDDGQELELEMGKTFAQRLASSDGYWVACVVSV